MHDIFLYFERLNGMIGDTIDDISNILQYTKIINIIFQYM
jgi:hypothetical protein